MLKKLFKRIKKSPAKVAGLLALGVVGGRAVYRWLLGDSPISLPRALDADLAGLETEAGGKLYYYVDSSAAGRPLLLIHSINAAPSSFEMKPLFDHFRQERPVYALDLPGFGFSERSSTRPYLPGVYSQVILQLIEDVIKEPVDIIALSLGSEFAATAAHINPERVRSLTLISPTGMMAREIDLPGEKIRRGLAFPLWAQALFDLLTIRPSIRYYSGQSFVGEPPPAFVEYAYATAHQPGARHAPFYFLSGQLFSPQIRKNVYETLTTPTLVIYDQDPNISFEKLPDLLAKNEQWQARRLTPSRGLPHWEMLPETAGTLDQFWESIP